MRHLGALQSSYDTPDFLRRSIYSARISLPTLKAERVFFDGGFCGCELLKGTGTTRVAYHLDPDG